MIDQVFVKKSDGVDSTVVKLKNKKGYLNTRGMPGWVCILSKYTAKQH